MDLGQPGSSDRMSLRLQTPGWVHRDASAQSRLASFRHPAAFAEIAEAEGGEPLTAHETTKIIGEVLAELDE